MISAGPATPFGSVPALLAELAGLGPILARTLIVVAHPDDETIGLGAQLCRLCDALLLHVTDGAPRDGEDARRQGFAEPADYAAARAQELDAALVAGASAGLRRAALGISDKDAFLDLAWLSRRVAGWLRREHPVTVVTHAYEGGHPDHDAAAFAVHAACRCLGAEERPAIIEFPSYHARDGQMVAGAFLPGGSREVTARLGEADLRRKRAMVDCFGTQREMLARFELGPERFRLAPAYDFRAPPHSGSLLYETFGWGISGVEWQRRAAEALGSLGLD